MTKAWLYQIRKLAKLRASGFFVVIRRVPVNMLGQGSLRLVKSVGLDFLEKNGLTQLNDFAPLSEEVAYSIEYHEAEGEDDEEEEVDFPIDDIY